MDGVYGGNPDGRVPPWMQSWEVKQLGFALEPKCQNVMLVVLEEESASCGLVVRRGSAGWWQLKEFIMFTPKIGEDDPI